MAREATFAEILQTRTTHSGDAFTFSKAGEIIDRRTYADLDERASRLAFEIRQCARPGDRAILLFPPGLGFVDAFFACLYAGVVPTPLALGLNKRQCAKLGALFLDARPTVVLGPSELRGRLPFVDDVPGFAWIDPVSVSSGPRLAPDPIELALLQYTSGSTSSPKGVLISHANLLANEAAIAEAFGHTSRTVGGGWLPLYHDMGLIGCMLQPIFVGFPVHLMSPLEFLAQPFRWLELISRHGIQTTGGPNFAYEACVQRIAPERDEAFDLRSWTLAFNGAEPIAARSIDAFARRFRGRGFDERAFFPCYGLAESTLLVTGGPRQAITRLRVEREPLDRDHQVVPGCDPVRARDLVGCGQVTHGATVKIVCPERCVELGEGEVGEIWVAGPSVASGYLHDRGSDTFAASLGDGRSYLRTGDLGFIHDRELFVTGRRRDMIIVGGKNHYAEDIEASIRDVHPAFAGNAAAAFAIPDVGAESLVVVHEVGRDDRAALGEPFLAELARGAVSDQHGVRLAHFVVVLPSSLPRTSSGKVQRFAARNQFQRNLLNLYPTRPHAVASSRCAP